MNVLELYCGIGGMHVALNLSQVEGTVKYAIDINQRAVAIYEHNFPTTNVVIGNIQGLTADKLNNLQIDTILMSPPCQPFTRNGNKRDINDPRSESFQHVLKLLPSLKVERILLENVKGFEGSTMHLYFMSTLMACGYNYKEFLLNPHEFGMPNSRTRYYCVARKTPFTKDLILTSENIFPLSDILDNATGDHDIPMHSLVKRYPIIDIVYPTSTRSCCFTKSYGRYIEGTGSIFCPKSKEKVDEVYKQLKESPEGSDLVPLLKQLELRFFTPREICRLMAFPEDFTFPDIDNRGDGPTREITTLKQRYMLLGNSINCKVVSELIKLLV